jgi:hypothetical protein
MPDEEIFQFSTILWNIIISPILPALIERFFETDLHDVPIEYFDPEFKDNLGIDLFATEFPN